MNVSGVETCALPIWYSNAPALSGQTGLGLPSFTRTREGLIGCTPEVSHARSGVQLTPCFILDRAIDGSAHATLKNDRYFPAGHVSRLWVLLRQGQWSRQHPGLE